MDIHTPTSAVDVLPTLAHVTGHVLPDWTDGTVLPPFREAGSNDERSVYVVRAAKNEPTAPVTRASTMLLRGPYKLLYFFGYVQKGVDELVKLYNVESDPEELEDLASSQSAIAAEMLKELKAKIAQVNRPYA
jgi:arylsulfatase A-like enzyme